MFYQKTKSSSTKRIEYLLLGKELKNQTSVAKKQYQKIDNGFESDKKEEENKKQKKSC